jgi:hypothetical protein
MGISPKPFNSRNISLNFIEIERLALKGVIKSDVLFSYNIDIAEPLGPKDKSLSLSVGLL